MSQLTNRLMEIRNAIYLTPTVEENLANRLSDLIFELVNIAEALEQRIDALERRD